MHELAAFAYSHLVNKVKSNCGEWGLPYDRLVTIWDQPSADEKVASDQTYHVLPA
jgi:hypothetical protein